LWSSLRPYSSMPSQSPAIRQSTARPLATSAETRLPPPTAENGHGRWTWHTSPSGSVLPTDNPCAAHRKCHRHSDGQQRAGVLRQNDDGSDVLAATVA